MSDEFCAEGVFDESEHLVVFGVDGDGDALGEREGRLEVFVTGGNYDDGVDVAFELGKGFIQLERIG